MKTIPVIIPYYRAEQELNKCLNALKEQSYKSLDIFVRDNSDDNILFTAAINEGLEKYALNNNVDYILILNQDAYVHKETINYLISTMEADQACGIACPIQLSEIDNSVFWGGSYDAFPLGNHQRDPLSSYLNDFDTFWANGACMLLRAKMVREIGFLDKNMRFICSDSDYSFTARARGWKVKVSHKAYVFHSSGSSGAGADEFINRIKLDDAIYFSKKWLTGELYRSLSYEGDKLTRIRVQVAVDNLRNSLR